MARTSYRLVITLVVLSHCPGYARESFNIHALELDNINQGDIDISAFTRVNSPVPGVYFVKVYINGKSQGEEKSIHFVSRHDGKLYPQLTPLMLKYWGVKVDSFTTVHDQNKNTPIDNIAEIIPMASVDFIFNQQRLNISIPQAAMYNSDPDDIKSVDWNEGVSSAFLNYNFNGGLGGAINNSKNYYANLQSGINVGAWRLRNYSTWQYDDKSGGDWQSINSYLQRDIALLKSQFILGESYSFADIFDSIPFRGAQLASDDNMLSDKQRGFAPVIRGIAHSNAEVTVKQNGYTILRTYVTPGEFVLNDLYPTASGGDLIVTVREADGREQSFTQPYAATPLMQREGRLKYALTMGKYRNRSDEPVFAQMTAIYGLSHGMTLYGGTQHTDGYCSYALGLGAGLGRIGAVSADITVAQSGKDKGASYRLLYSKNVQATSTNVTLAGYRYSTGGFYTFGDALDPQVRNVGENRRQRVQLDISQPVGEAGSIFLSTWQQNYWHRMGNELTLSGGWNGRYREINYSIFYSQNKSNDSAGSQDKQLTMNIQIPLTRFLPDSWASISMTSSRKGNSRMQLGINGTVLDDRNFSYNVAQGYTRGSGSDDNLGGSYKGRYGEINAGYSNNNNQHQLNYAVKGGMVIHPYGVTLSQPLAEQFAIVRTPGATGVRLLNYPGVMTDKWGNAIIPYVTPYRKNNLTLNVEELDGDIDVNSSVATVIPTRGASVLANFNMRQGARALLTLTYKKQRIPFGAIVTSSSGGSGIVDDNGRVYLSGLQRKEQLTITWGKARSCLATLKLPPAENETVLHLREVCD
ncbi:fimbrial biogenesis outer membrane usher protein [Salmonella enterica subsp. enterica serovar Redlands]|nr:fimbrial biogenesis outer membrane usher protein [Salmonella enterica subsp. enterica serovar Redlands]